MEQKDFKFFSAIVHEFLINPSYLCNLYNRCNTNKIVKSLNANKATSLDGIPFKLIKRSANVVDKYPASIISYGISRSYFSNGAKNALVRPIYKKKCRESKENYRPVSILNEFSSSREVDI